MFVQYRSCMFFWNGPNLKTCKFHWKLRYILKVGEHKKDDRLHTVFDIEFKHFSEMVQTWKPVNSIGNYIISLRSVKAKKHKKSLKNFNKTDSKTLAAKSSSLGSIFAPKLSLGASQGGPRASPGSPQGAQRRLQAASVAPVCLPWAPLVSPWLPLNTA